MGGWFRKEIKTRRRPEGPEDAHRRPRRPSRGQARRRAAADRRRRHLPGARARHDRRRRVGRPLRRREARLQQGRAVSTTIPAGGKAAPTLHFCSSTRQVERAAEEPTRRSRRRRRPTPTSTCRRSTTPATRRRCAAWSAPAPSCGRSRRRSWRPPTRPRTRSMTRPRPRTRTSRRSTTAYRAFRDEEYLWFQVAEYTYDNFMIRARARG